MTELFNRVIPCLLLQDGGLVKTTKFGRPRYVGDPINAIRIFNERSIDDLIVVNAKKEPVGLVDSQDLPKLKLM